MTEETYLIDLHDRSTCGLPLSAAEREQLERWYAHRDAAERTSLVVDKVGAPSALQEQINSTLGQVQTVTQRIQKLMAENDLLSQEVNALRQQLALSRKAQPV